MNNNNLEISEQDILNYYKQMYKAKILKEVSYEEYLDDEDKHKKMYESFKKAWFCIRPKSLLIYSIVIFAITFSGLFLTISKNEGYKSYKEAIEKNISLINNNIPHEHETLKLVSYLDQNGYEDYKECNYLFYSLGYCNIYNYRQYCSQEDYANKICNYMDYQYYLGNKFTCNFENYKAGKCNQIQYNDYLEQTGQISYEHKINFTSFKPKINLKCLTIYKIWCNIGDYDLPIYLSFLILLLIFISLLIFDLKLNKKTIISGVKYYIITILYIFFHIIFRIYTILFFILTYYGIFVSIDYLKFFPNFNDKRNITDPYFDNTVLIYTLEDKLWKDKRINAFIFCVFSFVLFILVLILSFYKQLIHNYLTFNFDERNVNNNQYNLSNIYRNASIKIGNNNYNFTLEQNKDLYLTENRRNIKYNLKK